MCPSLTKKKKAKEQKAATAAIPQVLLLKHLKSMDNALLTFFFNNFISL
jgi:hypothetical protein